MTEQSLEGTARELVTAGKGILAADETVGTISKRFEALGIPSTEESRRTYREMLFTAPGLSEFISGAIMYDETIRQADGGGVPLAKVLARRGIAPGIKVDTGAKALAAFPGETVTEGLDGLRDRLREYRGLGARFAKWRAVVHVTDDLRPARGQRARLARYAALCQEAGLVPIVEPEVLMDGTHTLARAEEVTGAVLDRVFRALSCSECRWRACSSSPTWSFGKDCSAQASVTEVATATLRCLRRHVPAAVPGIVFLSGGQDERRATAHLSAMNAAPGARPWAVSFSYGRALQDPALEAWGGRPSGVKAAQDALFIEPAATVRRATASTLRRWRAKESRDQRCQPTAPTGETTEYNRQP